MKTEKTLFSEALADAKAIKEAVTADATLRMQELIGPKLKSILEAALAEEMEEDDVAPVDESVLEKLQGLGLDETTLATLTAALEEKKAPKVGNEAPVDDAPAGDEAPKADGEIDETLDIDAALAEVEATFGEKATEEDDDDDNIVNEDGGLSEDEINRIIAEMDEEDDDAEAPIVDDEEEKDKDKDEAPQEAAILELKNQLAEAVKVIKNQKETISEINTLTAKMTYLNKFLVKESLNDEQKARIIKSFDKARTAGEAKALYEALDIKLPTRSKTLTESFGLSKNTKAVITESKNTWSPEALEMQKRAGIIQ